MGVEMDRQDLDRAINSLRKAQERLGKRGSGRHDSTVGNEDNAHKLGALRGICARCANFGIEFGPPNRGKTVRLTCQAGLSPLQLQRNTALGAQAQCNDYKELWTQELFKLGIVLVYGAFILNTKNRSFLRGEDFFYFFSEEFLLSIARVEAACDKYHFIFLESWRIFLDDRRKYHHFNLISQILHTHK